MEDKRRRAAQNVRYWHMRTSLSAQLMSALRGKAEIAQTSANIEAATLAAKVR
jgi:hypothetical protein